MLLVMTFNVWLILAVVLGHAGGYLALQAASKLGWTQRATRYWLGSAGPKGLDQVLPAAELSVGAVSSAAAAELSQSVGESSQAQKAPASPLLGVVSHDGDCHCA